ncbi:hypothetical protein GQ472_03395 [archaeon]|nr:hypothetical protein [archaeon]
MGFQKDMDFADKWYQAVLEKDSVVCAGLDPAEFGMGRGGKGLPEGVDKGQWALEYVEAVAPYCAAVKPNIQYWKDIGDMETLTEISRIAHKAGMVVIDDSKLSDIGSTNEAGVYYTDKHLADAVTYAPFAMNIEEVAEQGKKWNVGVIALCIMSNPEYKVMKNAIVNHEGKDMRMFEYIAMQCGEHDISSVVIGAPNKDKNHITEEEIGIVRQYLDNQLVLMPGVGEQGGQAGIIWDIFGVNKVIVNEGRSLMFPAKGYTWETKAIESRDYLNNLRYGARQVA